MKTFAGKNVLVTGATSGIGRGIAVAFGREGARVGVLGRRAKEAGEVAAEVTAAGGEGVPILADVGDREALAAALAPFLEEASSLDAVVSVAGLDRNSLLADATTEMAEQMFRTNTLGVLYMMQMAIPRMREQGKGSIVNITSIAASKVLYGNGLYGASKAATSMLTRTAAAEEGPHGIRINEVRPGPVDTPMLDRFFEESQMQGTGWDAAKIRSALPLRRIGEPQDIAAAVLWLCSDEARFVTGSHLDIDGGFTLA